MLYATTQMPQAFGRGSFGSVRAARIGGQVWLVWGDVTYALGYDPHSASTPPPMRPLLCVGSLWDTYMHLISAEDALSLEMPVPPERLEAFRQWLREDVLPNVEELPCGEYESAYQAREHLLPVSA